MGVQLSVVLVGLPDPDHMSNYSIHIRNGATFGGKVLCSFSAYECAEV